MNYQILSFLSCTQTRVTGLHFDTGDRIGLSIAKGSETYVQNVLMTYDGTAFTAADLLWYNDSNEKSTLTAYHPYSEQGMPAEFSVATDQTSGGASSDLLVAVKKRLPHLRHLSGCSFTM